MRAIAIYDEAGNVVSIAIPARDVEADLEFTGGHGRASTEVETDDLEGLGDLLADVSDSVDRDKQIAGALLTHFRFDARSGRLGRRAE